MLETANDLRFIIFSSNQKEDVVDFGPIFESLFRSYIEYVKKNYLYEQDAVIDVPKFKEATNGIFKEAVSGKKK